MLAPILAIGFLAVAFGLLLGYSAIRFRVEGDPVVDQLDSLLPQTQCGQCGYPGCRPYAEAVAKGEEEIDQCTPGGEATMRAIADLLGREPAALDGEAERIKRVALIDEHSCIGCTLCYQACPVDAIVGAARQVHTVIAAECTGCGLCVNPCPVECIAMEPVKADVYSWKWPYPAIPHRPQAPQERKAA